MSGSNEGSGKGPSKPATDAAGQKKPSAILDLKATEVRPDAPKAAAASPNDTRPAAATVEIKPPAGAPAAASKPADTKPTATTAASPKAAPATAPVTPARAGGGMAAVASHLFAGIAGGFLALLGADTIAPQLGLSGPSAGIGELQQRLVAVEAAAKAKPAAPSPELAQKLAAAEVRLGKIEDASRALPTLNDTQARLATEMRALSERLSKPQQGADADRLARLEDALNTLATAANNDPQTGRIPQLAQITGKLADLETALAGQMASVRKNVTQDVESRLGQATEAAEQARAGVQRIDRDFGAIKTEAARNSQRLETLDQTLRATKDESADLKTAVEGLKADVASQLKSVARPQDVSSALAPLNSKLAAVEQNLAGVVKGEDDRKANAERIVLSLELANLKRALDRGGAFGPELAAVQKVGGGKLDLKALEAVKDSGVPTVTTLASEFRTVAYQIIAADADPGDGSVVDKLISSAQVDRARAQDQMPKRATPAPRRSPPAWTRRSRPTVLPTSRPKPRSCRRKRRRRPAPGSPRSRPAPASTVPLPTSKTNSSQP